MPSGQANIPSREEIHYSKQAPIKNIIESASEKYE